MMLNKYVYHLEGDIAIQYRIIRVNQKTVFVQNIDRTREFTVRMEELEKDWHFTIADVYRDAIANIDKEMEELRAPIEEQLKELQSLKRRLKIRLENAS